MSAAFNPWSRDCVPEDAQREIARAIAPMSVHVHPDIVKAVAEDNVRLREDMQHEWPAGLPVEDYLFPGSACVFPGVRRFVGRIEQKHRLKYVPAEGAIIDENYCPRHLWTFLRVGRCFSGPAFKDAGLDVFELAHIFAHKQDRTTLDVKMFSLDGGGRSPHGLFTCAANVVLIRKGLAKPTDGLEMVRIAYFARHVELYGTSTLPYDSDFSKHLIPKWVNSLNWGEPFLPNNWRERLALLFEYRRRWLHRKFAAAAS